MLAFFIKLYWERHENNKTHSHGYKFEELHDVSGFRVGFEKIVGFIFKNPTSEDFTDNWDIITDIQPNISDHYLVWAELSITKDTD